MIRETGQITDLADGRATLQPDSRAGCARCASGGGCGAGLNTWLLSDRLDLVECRYQDEPPQVGERVTVEIEELSLLTAAALAYGMPVIFMLAAALLGPSISRWAGLDGGAAELVQGIIALVGLGTGGLLAAWLARRSSIAARMIPSLLRRVSR